MRHVAPGAKTILLPAEVYLDELDAHWPAFDALLQAARGLRPEELLVAPFTRQRFEERRSVAVQDEPGLQRLGLSGTVSAADA